MTLHNEPKVGDPSETRHDTRESAVEQPAVSIGLAVFNGENFLREAIDSLLKQSFQNFELIISDNASTDGTADIVREFQEHDSRIRSFRQTTNIGAGGNYLFVLEQAKAKLFMWATHDDIWAHNWLDVLVANITPADTGIRGTLIMAGGESIATEHSLPNFRQGDFVCFFLSKERDYRNHYMYSLFNIEKLLASDYGAFNLNYYPDVIFVYSMLEVGGLRSIPETNLKYRVHEQNLGHEYTKPWKGWKKFTYQVHPLRYYLDYVRHSRKLSTKSLILLLIPIKHLYEQVRLWIKGAREILAGKGSA